jgi:hypothetical protein|tara:strand:- start:669 stop:857 length:189 start_codon:yes stop_codon:yes gene_type:complete
MTNVKQFPDKFEAENRMLQDLNDLIKSYNGRMTNVAMLGVLQASTNFVFLSIAGDAVDIDDE